MLVLVGLLLSAPAWLSDGLLGAGGAFCAETPTSPCATTHWDIAREPDAVALGQGGGLAALLLGGDGAGESCDATPSGA